MGAVSYFTVGSNRLEEAMAFYDALLGSIGMKPAFEPPWGGRLYAAAGKGMFGVLNPHDDQPACIGNGSMGGFSFDTREEVAAFHAKAIELGGLTEGDPGERSPGVYFRDLDGNKLCGYKIG